MNLIVQNNPFLQVNPISLEDFKNHLLEKNKSSPDHVEKITQKVNSEDEEHVEKKQKTIALSTPSENPYSSNGYEFQFPLLTTQGMGLTSSSPFSFPMVNPASIPFPFFMSSNVGTYSSTDNNAASSHSIFDESSIVDDNFVNNFLS